MDLKKATPTLGNHVLSAVLLTALVGCSAPAEVEHVGLPDRSSTACQYQGGAANVLGPADSAFACRGKALVSAGALVGIAKAAKGQNYQLLAVSAEGGVKTMSTSHRGNVRLFATPVGVLAVSVEGPRVAWSAHHTDLSPLKSGEITLDGEILDLAVTSASGLGTCQTASAAEDPDAPVPEAAVLIAVLTATGVEIIGVGAAGEQTTRTRGLTFPEMPYCSELTVAVTEGQLKFAVTCLEVLPRIHAGDAGAVPTVDDFEMEDEVPPATDIVVTAPCIGGPLVGSIHEPVPAPPAPGYALKSYLKEQLPRPAGYRANMLEAVDLGDGRVFALACVGPDDGPAELQASVLTCPEHP